MLLISASWECNEGEAGGSSIRRKRPRGAVFGATVETPLGTLSSHIGVPRFHIPLWFPTPASWQHSPSEATGNGSLGSYHLRERPGLSYQLPVSSWPSLGHHSSHLGSEPEDRSFSLSLSLSTPHPAPITFFKITKKKTQTQSNIWNPAGQPDPLRRDDSPRHTSVIFLPLTYSLPTGALLPSGNSSSNYISIVFVYWHQEVWILSVHLCKSIQIPTMWFTLDWHWGRWPPWP